MATTQSNIKVTVVGDANQFSKEMRSAESSLERVERQINSMNKGFKAVKWGAIGGAAALGIGKLARSLNDATKAAISDRKQQTALNKVLKNMPGISKKAIKANEQWIDSMELATHVSDTDLRKAIGRLVVTTKDLGKAQDLAALATDVAAGKGVSYARALKEVETAAKKGTEEVDKLSAAYGGAAEAAADKDPYEKLKVIWGQLQESLGQALLPLLDEFSKWFANPVNKQKITDFITRVGEVSRSIGIKLRDALRRVDWNKLKEDLEILGGKFKTLWGWVTDLYDAFTNLPQGTKDFVADLLLLFAGWQIASRTPGLKLLVEWNEAAIKNSLNRLLGTKFGQVRMTAGVVNLTGPVAGVPSTGRTPERRADKSEDTTRAGTEVLDRAYIDAKDAQLKAEIAKTNARVSGMGAQFRAMDAATQARVNAEFAKLQAEGASLRASMKAAMASQDAKIAAATTRMDDMTIDLRDAKDGGKLWKRILGHVPVLGDLALLAVDLVTLVAIFGKKGKDAFTKPEAERNFRANTESNQKYTDQKVEEGYNKIKGQMDSGDRKLYENYRHEKDERLRVDNYIISEQALQWQALRKEKDERLRTDTDIRATAFGAQKDADTANNRIDAVQARFIQLRNYVRGSVPSSGGSIPVLAYPTVQRYATPQQSSSVRYTINVNSLVADKNTGREVVKAIQEYEYVAGKTWRNRI